MIFVIETGLIHLSGSVLTNISEWAHDNLIEMGQSTDKFDNPLLLYTEIMQDATPGISEYASLLEAFAFCEMKRSTWLFIKLKTVLHIT